MRNINETNSLKQNIIDELLNSKAKDISIINLQEKSDLCDYMIIASGTSDRHVKSISDKLVYYLKHHKSQKIHYNTEGLEEGKWALIDAMSILIHIFQPEAREFYNLEELWGTEENIDRFENDSTK